MKALLEPDKLYVAPSASLQACWFANHAAVTICGQFFARIPFGLAGREISRPHHCPLTTWVNFSFSFFKLPIWSISLSMVSARERFSSFITPSSACNALRSGSCPFSSREPELDWLIDWKAKSKLTSPESPPLKAKRGGHV